MPLALLALIPSLIKVADSIFSKDAPDAPSRGVEKKTWVMRILEIAFDELSAKGILPAIVRDHKEVVLTVLDRIIDETVAALRKPKSA